MPEEKKSNGAVVWSVVVLVVAVASFGLFKYVKKDAAVVETPVSTPVAPTATPTPVTSSYIYRDGMYSAIGQYMSPAGSEDLSVQLVLKDDIVTAANVIVKATRPESIRYQNTFIQNFKSQVVGKKLDDIKVGKVSGSSLTPKGFNDAVAQIKVSAKA